MEQKSVADLGKLVKQKYPGAYDDMEDGALGKSVKVKFPGSYDDYSDEAVSTQVNYPANPDLQSKGPIKRFGEGVYNVTAGPFVDIYKHQQENVQKYGPFLATLVTGFDLAKGLIKGSNDEAVKALQSIKSGHVLDFIQHLPGIVPGVGPAAVQASEEMQRGNVAGGLGMATGLIGASTAAKIGELKPSGIRVLPKISNPNPVEAAAVEAGIREGVPVSAGVATGNPLVKGVQAITERTSIPGSFIGQSARQAEVKGLTEWGDRLASKVNATAIAPEQAGKAVAGQLKENISNFHESASSAYGRLRLIESDPASMKSVIVGEKPIKSSTMPGVEPEVVPIIEDSIQSRLHEIEDLFSQGIGELSGKAKNVDLSNFNADAIKNLTRSDTGFGHINLKKTFPELESIKASPGEIREAISNASSPLYKQVRSVVQKEILSQMSDDIKVANEAAIERRAIKISDNPQSEKIVKNVPLPIDMRPIKAALDPVYKERLKTMPIAQQQASPGLIAIKNILDADDYLPASVAEKNLSALKKDAGYNVGKGMRTQSQGLAAHAVAHLQEAIDTAVTQAGPEAIEALKAGRQFTRQKFESIGILKALRKEPVQAFNQATWAKDAGIDYLRKLSKQAPEEMPKIGRAYIDQLFSEATAAGGFERTQGIWSKWQNLGAETKKLIFKNPQLVGDLDNFFLLAKKMAENPNPSGTAYTAAITAAGTMAITNPATAVVTQIAGGVLAKLLHDPQKVRLLMQGMKVPLSNKPGATILAGQILKNVNASDVQIKEKATTANSRKAPE
jgi:hypothetical protein